MTGLRRRTRAPGALVVPVLLAIGLLVVLWAASAGPVDVIGPSTARAQYPRHVYPSSSRSPSSPAQADPIDRYRYPKSHVLAWVGDLLAWSFFVAVVVGLAFGLVWLWRHRWRRPPPPPTIDLEPLPDLSALTEALARDAEARLDSLQEGDPRNGIVRCWLRLEEVIADAGLARRPAETSSEFTVRVLRTLDLDPYAIGTLAGLYREARFSEHLLGEDARTTARGMLEQLHRELRELGGTVDVTGQR